MTREIAAEYTVAENKVCKKIEIANVDAAGGPELVCLVGAAGFYGAGHVLVLDPATMTKKWQTVDFGSYDTATFGMTIANVDTDTALEIVTGGGYVFDGVTHDSQWAYSAGFGALIDAGDVTGDGVAEIVASSGSVIRVFDAVSKLPIGEIAGYHGGTGAVLVKNIEGSATAEMLIGDSQGGYVSAYRYDVPTATGVQIFQIATQGSGVSTIAAGDVDNDGAIEFIWGADIGSTAPDSIVVAGRNPTIGIEWINANPKQLTGNFLGGMQARIAANQSRLMFATPRTDSDGARLIALDPATGRQSISAVVGTNWSGAFALDMVDYDNDGIDEVFYASSDTYTGYLAAYDFASNTQLWKSPSDAGVSFAIAHGDFSNDGFADLVSISANYVNVFDVRNSNLLWRSASLAGGGGIDVAVANVEGDATPEIIAATRNRLIVYKRHTSPAFIESSSIELPVGDLLDLLVADADGDGTQEIYILRGLFSNGGSVQKYSPSLQLLATFAINQPVNSLHLESLPTARRNLVVSTGEQNYILQYERPMLRGLDPTTGAEVWRSPPFVAPVTRNSLFYVDPNNDGRMQISFGAGANAYVTQ